MRRAGSWSASSARTRPTRQTAQSGMARYTRGTPIASPQWRSRPTARVCSRAARDKTVRLWDVGHRAADPYVRDATASGHVGGLLARRHAPALGRPRRHAQAVGHRNRPACSRPLISCALGGFLARWYALALRRPSRRQAVGCRERTARHSFTSTSFPSTRLRSRPTARACYQAPSMSGFGTLQAVG